MADKAPQRSRYGHASPVSALFEATPSVGAEAVSVDGELALWARDLRKFDIANRLAAVKRGEALPLASPSPMTVPDQVQVSKALTDMATGVAGISQKQAEIAQSQLRDADQKAREAAEAARREGDSALAVVEKMHAQSLEYQARVDEARREADEARREADKERDAAERQRLADRLDRIEERYQQEKAQIESRAQAAEARAQQLREALNEKKGALEELLDAAQQNPDQMENLPLVRIFRALAPGEQSAILGADGKPIDPNLRFQHGMADVLVETERKKADRGDRWAELGERIFGLVEEAVTGRPTGGVVNADQIREAMAAEAAQYEPGENA